MQKAHPSMEKESRTGHLQVNSALVGQLVSEGKAIGELIVGGKFLLACLGRDSREKHRGVGLDTSYPGISDGGSRGGLKYSGR